MISDTEQNSNDPSAPASPPRALPGRREAIAAGTAAVATAALPAVAASGADLPGTRKRVVVVGGGIGGLSCAYELMERGHEVTVLEASERTGGHVKTMRDPLPGGLYADLGAEQFTKPGYEEFWRYVEAFGLTALPWNRNENRYRRIKGKGKAKDEWIPEEEYYSRARLAARGFNSEELDYIEEYGWHNLAFLYFDPYIEKIEDEYQPFGNGLDHLDQMLAGDFLAEQGASDAAARTCFRAGGRRSSPDKPPAGSDVSALSRIWGAAIFKLRGLPYGPANIFHLEGGNEEMTRAFAQRLGDRIRRNCPVKAVEQKGEGATVTVRYEQDGRKEELTADHVVLAVSSMLLPLIEMTPGFSEERIFAITHTTMGMYSRVLLQSSTPFWEGDIPSINLQTGDLHMPSVSETAREVEGPESLLFGIGMPAQTPEATLAAFRDFYPGKAEDTIEQAIVYQWVKEQPTCYGCERRPFPFGQLARIWPKLIEPAGQGRIHFVGAAFDNLWRGMDAATRSAVRAAKAIHAA